MARCFAASSATAGPGWRHLRSGLRRSVPKPVQGASTRTRSILRARRLIFASRSFASSCGCTLDSPERASRGLRPREAPVVRVERVDAPLRAHQRAEQQRLAAGARAEVPTMSVRFGATR